jgi:hypothetical protein
MKLKPSRRDFFAAAAGLPVLAGTPAQSPSAPLSDAQKETFLRKAKVVRTTDSPLGITGTLHATLSDSRITHEASIQTIDVRKMVFQSAQGTELNFKDSWKFGIAAYRLDRLLELRMTPVSVERSHKGNDACVTWWVDDVLTLELDRHNKKIEPPDPAVWNDQMNIVRVFDQLICNIDRNLGNLVIDKQWRMWMIDHSRAFRPGDDIREPKNLTRCDRALLDAMKRLTEPQLKKTLGRWLVSPEIKGLLGRRDRIVALFEKLGPAALYDSPRRTA